MPDESAQIPRADRPRVGVVIPCYNHGRFVAEAVRSALVQESADIRVVIVDDGSNDATTSGACDACMTLPGAEGRVAIAHQSNAGLSAARNAGAWHATLRDAAWGEGERGGAEYLVFLDADDWIEPSFVRALHAALVAAGGGEAGSDLADGAASHAYCQERLVELGQGTWTVPEWDPLLLMVTNLHPVTALVRVEAFDAVGGFDASMRDGYEDWDLWLKCAERGWRGVRVREPLFIWRRHSHETMIHGATSRHDALFRRLIDNHADLYGRHWRDLVERSNSLLRRADAAWLDENLDAIVIRDLKKWVRDLVRERDEARGEVAAIRSRVEESVARAADLERALAAVEAKPVVRMSKAVHRLIDRLPTPLAAPARGLVRAIKRASPPTDPAAR